LNNSNFELFFNLNYIYHEKTNPVFNKFIPLRFEKTATNQIKGGVVTFSGVRVVEVPPKHHCLYSESDEKVAFGCPDGIYMMN
jgi:hypothetical protein